MARYNARPEGRVPPYAQEAETAVLGSVLLNNASIDEVLTIIDEDDIYVESNRRIFEAMAAMRKRGVPIDHVTLGAELRTRGDLEKIGGAMVLMNLTDAVATSANVGHYAGIVREKAAKRRVIYGAQEIVAQGFTDTDSEGLDDAIDKLAVDAMQIYRTQMPEALTLRGDNVIDMYNKVASGYRGVPLPWPTLTNMTAGLWNKTVTIFVARPGVGKTFVAVIAGRHAWLEGSRVLIISPEMSKDEIAERFFVVEAHVSYRDVIAGTLADAQLEKLEQTVEDCKTKENLWIMDSDDDLSQKGMERAIRACQPDLVAIDSIYDLRIKGDRRERLVGALDWLKGAAKKYNFAAVGFAQQNRVAELSEKKGGGARLGTIALADEVGQDSHAVFALEQTKDMKADKIMRIKPLKLRRGQQFGRDGVEVHWDFDVMFFDEKPKDEDGYEEDDDGVPF